MSLFFETVRHLSLRQILTRAVRMAERAWWRLTAPPPLPWRPPVPADHRLLTAPEGSRLRGFQEQSFEWARELDAEAFRQAARSWIEAHPHRRGDAWHPYPTSLRIASWCDALSASDDDAGIRASLSAQARFLARHLEHDVRGNHLLENARALVRAGAFLGDASLKARGLEVLRSEVPEQILADGGHFERAPGYHVRVLEVLEDAARFVDASWLRDAIVRMQAFLETITGPNGRLPLLKDTVMSNAPDGPSSVMKRREGSTCSWLADSGFAVMRNGEDFLIADFGRVCPDYLPAHAHADLFSFELTISDVPVIVDSGVFEYAEGEWRKWFRSTAAHNTVEIDGRDQSEMWGSFRVGRRARPSRVVWTNEPSFTAISGEHDGYAPVLHHRTIVALHEARIWIVVDRVSGPAAHVARNFIHLHPDAEVPIIAPLGAAITESEGWYSERFGEKRRNRVLVLERATPGSFGYVVSANEMMSANLRDDGTDCVMDIASLRWQGTIRVGPPGASPSVERVR